MFRVRAVEVPCVLNIAAVKLKSKDFDDAIYECNKVLEIEVSIKIEMQTQNVQPSGCFNIY